MCCILELDISNLERDSMSKQFLGVLAGIMLVFIGIFVYTGNKTKETDKGSGDKSALTQHVQGNKDAKVTLLEYGDYQCQFCAQYYPTVKQVQAKYNDQIKFQFRNLPLTNLHQNAFAASRAAEAADLQGKFWEMHDALYEPANWQVWSSSNDPTPLFATYAKQLGLNTEQYKKDFASSKVNNRINADLAEGTKLGLTGTPSFFINGKKTEIANSVAAFDKVIQAALTKQGVKTTEPSATGEPATPTPEPATAPPTQ